MQKVTYFVANDGKMFDDEHECISYEKELEENSEKTRQEVFAAAKVIKTYCNKHTDCSGCVFEHYCGLCPAQW